MDSKSILKNIEQDFQYLIYQIFIFDIMIYCMGKTNIFFLPELFLILEIFLKIFNGYLNGIDILYCTIFNEGNLEYSKNIHL